MVPSLPAHWLNRRRLRDYPRIFLLLYALLGTIWLTHASHGVDFTGKKPLGADFIAYWSASKLALTGSPVTAYDARKLVQIEQQVVPGIEGNTPWQYPPTFFLLILPFALLPYLLSWLVFEALTLAAFLATVRKIVALPGSWTLLLAFPGIVLNAVQGQNAFLTAALMGGALFALTARPVLAGVLIGLLTIKPHLGLLLPLALICGGHWKTLVSAALTSAVFLLLSVWVLGFQTLPAFWHELPTVAHWVQQGILPLDKMPTFFAFARKLGAPVWLAYTLHGAIALMVAILVAWIWKRCREFDLRTAALVAGTLLISPYLFDYDLAWLGLALAWFGRYGARNGWLRGEREMLVAGWLLPILVAPGSAILHLQFAPFVLLGLFLVIVRRAKLAERASFVEMASG